MPILSGNAIIEVLYARNYEKVNEDRNMHILDILFY